MLVPFLELLILSYYTREVPADILVKILSPDKMIGAIFFFKSCFF